MQQTMADGDAGAPHDAAVDRLRRTLSIPGYNRQFVATWALYTAVLVVGRIVAGHSFVRVDDLAFGAPAAWFVGLAYSLGKRQLAPALTTVVVAIALLGGLFA